MRRRRPKRSVRVHNATVIRPGRRLIIEAFGTHPICGKCGKCEMCCPVRDGGCRCHLDKKGWEAEKAWARAHA